MIQEQKTEIIDVGALVERCRQLSSDGWRLVQIGCTGLPDGSEISYTFDRNYEFLNLRIIVSPETPVPSVQGVYPYAYLYENEMAELFGVKMQGMAVDFNGLLYKISKPTPFSEVVAKDDPKKDAREKEAD